MPDGSHTPDRHSSVQTRYRCAECGMLIVRIGEHTAAAAHDNGEMQFCSKTHKDQFWNRAKTRGAKLYVLALRWRKKRAKGDFQEVTRLLDRWIQDDSGKYNPLPMGIKSATRMV